MNERIICDTNVWYDIAMDRFNPSPEIILIPTSFSLYEIVSTELIANNPHLIQNVIKAVKTYGREIIPVNPFDFIIMNHDTSYQADNSMTNSILKEFSNVLNINMDDENFKIDEDVKAKIIETSKASRAATYDFAAFSTEKINTIYKSLIQEKGIKKRLQENTLSDIKEMVKGLLNDYLKNKNYSINYDNFDWNDIELFLIVTENYFKHLETTKGIKVDPNDAVDWLNTLYVRPGYKYLTFEKSWRKNISNDERIAHYLYNPTNAV